MKNIKTSQVVLLQIFCVFILSISCNIHAQASTCSIKCNEAHTSTVNCKNKNVFTHYNRNMNTLARLGMKLPELMMKFTVVSMFWHKFTYWDSCVILCHYLEFRKTFNIVLWCKFWDGQQVHATEYCWVQYPVEAVDMKERQDTQYHLLGCLCNNTTCLHLVW
jgi:hypothetical protein